MSTADDILAAAKAYAQADLDYYTAREAFKKVPTGRDDKEYDAMYAAAKTASAAFGGLTALVSGESVRAGGSRLLHRLRGV